MSEKTNPSSEESQPAADAGADANPAADFDTLVARLDKVHTDLARRRWWLNFSNRSFMIIGLLLMALLTAYFTFGYVQIKDLANSQNLYALFEQNVRAVAIPGRNQRVPTTLSQARAYIEKEIAEGAPKLAAQASEQLMNSAPKMREYAEDFAIDQAQSLLDRGAQMTEAKFRELVTKNRYLIQQCMKDLEENEEVAEERLDELVAAMEHELDADLRGQVEQVLNTLHFLNDRLVTLSEGERLTSEGQLERQLVMILRRIQLQEGDPSLAGQSIDVEPMQVLEAMVSTRKVSGDGEQATTLETATARENEPVRENERAESKDDQPDENDVAAQSNPILAASSPSEAHPEVVALREQVQLLKSQVEEFRRRLSAVEKELLVDP